MGIQTQRDLFKASADAARLAGHQSFLDMQRAGLKGDKQAWFRSGRALMRSAFLTIEVAQSGSDRLKAIQDASESSPAADLQSVFDDCQLWPVAQMLISMAFEAMLKGLLADAGTPIPTGRSGHDLRQ